MIIWLLIALITTWGGLTHVGEREGKEEQST